jgi:tRNA1Val (adenine37-N6)-methyltransferase
MGVFHFKHFQIKQDTAALKVGTDAMLLGSLCDFSNAHSILDIGTGTGVLALMCAQRFQATHIVAIDSSEHAYNIAISNFQQNPFPTRIQCVHSTVQQLKGDRFDGIICNPPYFEDSTKNVNQEKSIARHTDTLPLVELASNSKRLLTDHGRIWIIYPYLQKERLYAEFKEAGFSVSEEITIFGKPEQPARIVVCFTLIPVNETNESKLVIRDINGQYTNEYKVLTQEFHDRVL